MSFKYIYIQIAILISLFSCSNKNDVDKTEVQMISLAASDTALHLINGTLFYQSKPFNGELKESWPAGGLKFIQHIANGKQQGLSETFYQNGNKESTRWYENGEKDSVHTGWWENGNKKYEYHFKDGDYNGLFSEWYQSGKKLQRVMYANGKELYGQGWRETGKLYMNFIMKDGRRFGMNNSNLCYGVKNSEF